MSVDVKIPSLGESVSEGVVARWLKADGDYVNTGETLLELETDKAMMEIPAETSGKVAIQVAAGATVEVGQVVATIDERAEAPAGAGQGGLTAPAPAPPEAVAENAAAAPAEPKAKAEDTDEAPAEAEPGKPAAPAAKDAGPLSPAVRKLVAEHDLDPSRIPGTGKDGRLTKADVQAFLNERPAAAAPSEPATPAPAKPEPAPAAKAPQAPTAPPTPSAAGPDHERIPLTTLRKRIAERLVEAQRTAAILTTFNEIDMSAVLALRKRYRDDFEKRHGVRLGFMGLFGRACCMALKDVPAVNAQIDGDDMVQYHRVHLGIAVGTERGLVVPIVKNADLMSLAELEAAIGAMAIKARDRKITPDDLSGGTFTISNGGVYGSLLSTPILNPPQSGILGMHKIEERPVVIDGEITIRPMMYVALSYDHRLVDGEGAVTFLVRVKNYLEDPARMVLEA